MLYFALAAVLFAPQDAAQAAAPAGNPAAIETAVVAERPMCPDGLFCAASGPMTLIVGDADSPLTYASMVNQYAELTGQHIVMSADTKSIIARPLLLDRTMVVPAALVQATFEGFMHQGDLAIRPVMQGAARIVEIESLWTGDRNTIRSRAVPLAPDRIQIAVDHPAVLFTATVTLPNTDARQVSNSLRTMITDANTQMMVPAGNHQSMVLVGFGRRLASMNESLKVIDANSQKNSAQLKTVTEAIRLEHAEAQTLVALLNGAYGVDPGDRKPFEPKFLADERTNSILMTVLASQADGIKNVMAALDVK